MCKPLTEQRREIPVPLRDVTVLDFSWLLPGPYCSLLLAELGATVIKIEGPGGDYAREMLPGMFKAANHGKLGLSLDLKVSGSLEVIDRLVRQSDVVLEGFRPGVTDRLGIGYGRLSSLNSRIVYASVSGYGASGPQAQTPGHDLNYCAAAGVLVIPGRWGDPPARSGLPLADLASGLHGALAIVAALRERDRSGRGGYIDVSMFASVLHLAQMRFADYDETSLRPWHHVNPLNDIFEAADGRRITLALVERKFWLTFCERVGLNDPLCRRDFDVFREGGEPAAGQRLRSAVAGIMKQRTAAEWSALFSGSDIPFAVVLTPQEALSHPQAVHSGYVEDAEDLKLVRFCVGGFARKSYSPAPKRGQHTDEVLEMFGFSPAEIAQIRERKIATD